MWIAFLERKHGETFFETEVMKLIPKMKFIFPVWVGFQAKPFLEYKQQQKQQHFIHISIKGFVKLIE